MWFVAMTVAGIALGGEPAEAQIDCSVHDDAACDTAKTRLAAINETLRSMDCTKGRKKKQDECKAEKATLELEQTELTTRWAAPSEEEDEASTRGVDLEVDEGPPVEGMEIDISDE